VESGLFSVSSGLRRLPCCLLVCAAGSGILRVQTSGLTADLHVARSGHQATLLLDGKVLATGGSDERGQAVGLAEVFHPRTRTWSRAAANLTPRLGHAATLLDDGRVFVVGGVSSGSSCEPNNSAEVYDPSSDRWTLTPNAPVRIGSGTVAVTLKDGRVLVAGGGTACGDAYRSATLFDPASHRWSETSSMQAASQFHVATRLGDGRVLVSGAATTIYDPQTASWAPLGDPRSLTEVPCQGDVQTYAPVIGRDSVIAKATSENCRSLTMLPANMLLFAGGLTTSNTPDSSVQLLDRRTGEDLRSWPMRVARVGHTATRMKNGAVLIAGGRYGAARIAGSEIYLPRLPYETAIVATPRGPSRRFGSYEYGSWLATATTSRNTLVISYGRSELGTPLIEWDHRRTTADRRARLEPREGEVLHPPSYVRALAHDLPDFNSIRIDERDNIWAVSSAAQEIFKISGDGNVLLRFGRPGSIDNAASDAQRAQPSRRELDSPSDLAVDRRGNVFVADAAARPRIIKFDSRGRYLGATGRQGSRPGDLDRPHSIATDGIGNVYVADSGNARIQVFDNALELRAVYDNIGTPWAICITPGSPQFLYSASNPDLSDGARGIAEIYKLELDGTILGKAVGDELGNEAIVGTLNHIHCRDANTIVGLGYRNLHAITFAR
jgi:hypothetical protein